MDKIEIDTKVIQVGNSIGVLLPAWTKEKQLLGLTVGDRIKVVVEREKEKGNAIIRILTGNSLVLDKKNPNLSQVNDKVFKENKTSSLLKNSLVVGGHIDGIWYDPTTS